MSTAGRCQLTPFSYCPVAFIASLVRMLYNILTSLYSTQNFFNNHFILMLLRMIVVDLVGNVMALMKLSGAHDQCETRLQNCSGVMCCSKRHISYSYSATLPSFSYFYQHTSMVQHNKNWNNGSLLNRDRNTYTRGI